MMRNIKTSNFLFLLVGTSAISWFLLSLFTGTNLSDALAFFKLVPNVVTIDSIAIVIFTKWLWRCKIFKKWLVPFPYLGGTWVGSIHSDWLNPETGKSVPPIPVMLTIKQSFFNISCLMQTGEMKSHSFIEGFLIDEDRQVKQLSYSYTSKPRIIFNNRSLAHDGTIVFDIIEHPVRKLKGRYWTERNTKGEIEFIYKSRVIQDDLLPELGNHPVTENDDLKK
jgi:hypothetical protein